MGAEEIADRTGSEEKPIDVRDDNNTKPELKEEEPPSLEQTPAKHIISSEEEAKARLAEKRRLMKEKMEREAELERQRLAEIERIEEERRLKEEEEERKAMEEAEVLAAAARKVEERGFKKQLKRHKNEKPKKERNEMKKN